jgi:hypothetical protein
MQGDRGTTGCERRDSHGVHRRDEARRLQPSTPLHPTIAALVALRVATAHDVRALSGSNRALQDRRPARARNRQAATPRTLRGDLDLPDPFSQPGRFWRGNLHTHSTRSDGVLEPAEVCRRYRDEGYDFLALTDHFVGAYGYPVVDTRAFRAPGFTTLLGAEVHSGAMANGELWHILTVGLRVCGARHRGHGTSSVGQPGNWLMPCCSGPVRCLSMRGAARSCESLAQISAAMWGYTRAFASMHPGIS